MAQNFSTEIKPEDIGSLMELEKDQLYALIGTQVLGTDVPLTKSMTMDLKGISERKSIVIPFLDSEQKGRLFVRTNKAEIIKTIKDIICTKNKFCEKQEDILKDANVIVLSLIPLLIPGIGIPAATAAVIVVLFLKYYARTLCECP
jgi:hypothetical protein